jgi:inositol monophosphatase 3
MLTIATMSLYLSPLGLVVFFPLGLGLLCHPHFGFLAYNILGHFSLFCLRGRPEAGKAEVSLISKHSFNILLRLLWC